MNFKTIFSVAALALIATVNASPINNRPIKDVERECIGEGLGKLLVDKKSGQYTCLRKNKPDELNYRTCFFSNQDILCVDEGFNTIPSCSKNSGATDYTGCAYKILEMIDDGSDKLATRIRKYPTHEKIFYSYVVDQKECRGNNGIVLSYKTSQQYICLEPATPKTIKPNDTHCARLNGSIYCVNQDDTSIDVCVKRSWDYDSEACKKILKEYGQANHYEIEEL